MNIHLQNSNLMAFGQSRLFGGRLKSTAQKLERQAERDSQVAFFENQKANLKNIEPGGSGQGAGNAAFL